MRQKAKANYQQAEEVDGVTAAESSATYHVEDLRAIRGALGLKQEGAARMLGISLRNLSAIETGAKNATGDDQRRITELARLQRALATVVRAEAIPGWLERPNPAFGGLKPIEVVERGRIDEIWRMIHHLQSGNAN